MEGFNPSKYNILTVKTVELSRIRPNPNQPRSVFGDEGLEELAASIREHGVLQPITVRRIGVNEYELIAGERRLRASALAGFDKIPAIVTRATEEESSVLALIENIQRENLNYFEEARAYERLMKEYGQSQEELAQMVGKSQPAVANKLRLLRFPGEFQEKLLEAGLSERHARAFLKCKDEEEREKILDAVIAGGLSVARTEELIEKAQRPKDKPSPGPTVRHHIRDIRLFTNTVNQAAELMRKSGVPVELTENKTEDYYEMVIRVPYHQ